MKGNKIEMFHRTLGKNCSRFFFSFFEQYQSEYHCYSKSLAFFCLEALDLQRQLSYDTRWPVSWVGRGASAECLSAVVLWVSSSSPTAQHFLLGSTWPTLSLARKSSSSKTGQSRLSATHGISNRGRGGERGVCHCSTLLLFLPSPPSLSSLTL